MTHYCTQLLAGSAIFLLTIITYFASGTARADSSFELTYYDPKLRDYIPGYSINLMRDGSLIGYPRKLSTCTSSLPDPAECKTNMCRVSIQMQAWRACQEEYAREQREVLPEQSASNRYEHAARLPGGVTTAEDTELGVADATRCFLRASNLLRERVLVIYSTDLTSDEISNALALIEDELSVLQRADPQFYQVPCGMYISNTNTFPRLTALQLLRLYIMLEASTGEHRSRLIAVARLAHESTLPSRSLSQEIWHECFVQLQYLVFVRADAASKIGGNPVDFCPAFLRRPDLLEAAHRDLRSASGL